MAWGGDRRWWQPADGGRVTPGNSRSLNAEEMRNVGCLLYKYKDVIFMFSLNFFKVGSLEQI